MGSDRLPLPSRGERGAASPYQAASRDFVDNRGRPDLDRLA